MNVKFRLNKILESGSWWQIPLFGIGNVCIFSICMVLYCWISGSEASIWNPLDGEIGAWDSFRLFIDSNSILDKKSPTEIGNVILLITELLGTIFFSGLIVSIITNVISLKVDAIKEGHIHYKLKDHVVIIGYDNIVPSIISEIISAPAYKNCKIVLQTSDSVEDVRCTLLAKLPLASLKRVVVIHAPRQSVEELKQLYTANAKEIFIVGDRSQSDHDAENIRTFEDLVEIHKDLGIQTSKPLMIWFENEASYAALQLNDICEEWRGYFEFRPYNFYKRWANRLLTNSDYGKGDKRIIYPELDHKGIGADSKKHVHLIIVGMNRMGTALAKEAAHLLHFPNFDKKNGKNRTRITFIDDNADREMNFFMGRLPGYFNLIPSKYMDLTCGESEWKTDKNEDEHFLDVQFEFIKGRVESNAVRQWLTKQLEDPNEIITIAICISNPSQSFGMAMYLPEEIYTRGRNKNGNPWKVEDESQVVNIFVRQEKTGALIKTFGDAAKSDSAQNKRYANIYPFGMVDESFSLKYYSNHLAMAFNYIYTYYFNYNETLPSSIPDIDTLTEEWKTLSTALQWSNLYLADSIEFKLRSIDLTPENAKYATISEKQIEELAYTEHSRWNMEKLLLGYRGLTPEEKELSSEKRKVLKNKLYAHQLIKPYGELAEGDKELDRNIIRKLPDILRMLHNQDN